MARGNLILKKEWETLFADLPDEQAGQLIKAAFACHAGEEVCIDDPILAAVFGMIANVIAENAEKYEQKCRQNAENRRKAMTTNDDRQRPSTTVNDRQQPPVNINKNIKEKVSPKGDTKKKKHKHGEYGNVLLTDAELERLQAEFGDTALAAIKFLDEYIEEKGYTSKSHNLAIRRWVIDAVKKPTARSGTPNRFANFSQRQQTHEEAVSVERQLLAAQRAQRG